MKYCLLTIDNFDVKIKVSKNNQNNKIEYQLMEVTVFLIKFNTLKRGQKHKCRTLVSNSMLDNSTIMSVNIR